MMPPTSSDGDDPSSSLVESGDGCTDNTPTSVIMEQEGKRDAPVTTSNPDDNGTPIGTNKKAKTSSVSSEEKKEDPADLNTQQFPLGTMVQLYFKGYGFFNGQVVEYSKRNDLYRIQYTDGDMEQLDPIEMQLAMTRYIEQPKALQLKELKLDEIIESCNLWSVAPHLTEEYIWEQVHENPLPPSTPQHIAMRMVHIVKFYLFVFERQRTWQRRQGKTERCGPFTRNFILREYHCCNNYRELDRGTCFFRSEVLRLKDEMQQSGIDVLSNRLEWLTQVLWMSYCYRLCNQLESFDRKRNPAKGIPRLGKFDAAFKQYIRTFQDGGDEAFFTGAHQTTNYDRYILWCMDTQKKHGTQTVYEVAKKIDKADSLEDVCKNLRVLRGVGSFFSWQIACDLAEAHCLKHYNDEDTFCELGPGALMGLAIIFGNDKLPRLELVKILLDLLPYVEKLSGISFPIWDNHPVTLKLLEHGLCEYQKYIEIAEAIGAGRTPTGQRRWTTRERLDSAKQCHGCGIHCSDCGREIRCDTCHLMLCQTCKKDKPCNSAEHGDGWICGRCEAFENYMSSSN